MLGLTGLGQSSIAGFPPQGTPPPPVVSILTRPDIAYQTQFEIQSSIRIECAFMDALENVYADPTNVFIFVRGPNGITNRFDHPFRDGVGHYHFILAPSRHGVYTYKWQGTGALAATTPDMSLTVNGSPFIADS